MTLKFENVHFIIDNINSTLEHLLRDQTNTIDTNLENVKGKVTAVDSNIDDINTDLEEVKTQLGHVTECRYFTLHLLVRKALTLSVYGEHKFGLL